MNYSKQQLAALKDLLYKIADDQLIIGHRNSEWTGLGPILEEDIAFSSIAQDKIGQSLHVYEILHSLGENDPDTTAFTRKVNEYKCCHFVEYPIGEYDFSLMRNFLFNHSEAVRFDMLSSSSFEPLQQVAKKYKGEIKYHTMHSETWIKQLSQATEESHNRMQKSLDNSFNFALGIFEESQNYTTLHEMKVFNGENALRDKWLDIIIPKLESSGLKIPEKSLWKPLYGGRAGKHSEHLLPLLNEMTEVFKIDPKAEW